MIHKVGLTGGVGAGKSEVATLLRDRGIVIVDLDDVGKKVSLSPEVIRDINQICGLDSENLDRAKVRDIIFSTDAIRKKIEERLHPVILEEFQREVRAAEEAGHRLIVCEAALLVESGYHKHLDDLIVVTAPEAQRKNRLMTRDSIDATLAQKIIDAQTTDIEKVKHATIIIKNDTTLDALATEVRNLIETWRTKNLLDRIH